MKNFFLPIVHACANPFKAALAGFALLAVCSTQANAQNANALPAIISVVDLVDVNWKPAAEYAAVVAAERVVAAQKIATPGLPAAELALFTGYDLMLGYMEADLAANLPVDGIANNSFKRVSDEAPNNPALQDMSPVDYTSLYGALVPKLAQ